MNALEQRVLEIIGESTSSPDVFTDDDVGMAPIRDSINDAIQEYAMLTGGFKKDYFLPLREAQAFYRLRPLTGYIGWITDCWSVTQRYRLEQTDLIRLTAHDPRWMVTSAEPRAYIPIGMDVVGFYPKPSGSDNIIQMTVVEIPQAYTADKDMISLRSAFEYGVVHYAVGEYWASRGDALEAQTHLQAYIDALGLREKYSLSRDQVQGLQTPKDTAVLS